MVRLNAQSAVGTKHPGFKIHRPLSIVSNVNTSYLFMGYMPTYCGTTKNKILKPYRIFFTVVEVQKFTITTLFIYK